MGAVQVQQRIDIRDRGPRPADGWTLDYAPGQGHFVVDPRGRKASAFFDSRSKADVRRDELRQQANAKAKKGPRPCLCCGALFDSDGIHNRLCQPCKSADSPMWRRAH